MSASPPKLDAFAAECVASGRYANVSEVHRAALRLLQAQEERRHAFAAMLGRAEREGEQRGGRVGLNRPISGFPA